MAEFAYGDDDHNFGGRQNPVLVDDDDDGDIDEIGRRQQEVEASARAPARNRRESSVELKYIDLEELEDKLGNELQDVIDLTDDTEIPIATRPRQQSTPTLDRYQEHVRPDGLVLTTGMLVELQTPLEDHFPGRFFKIRRIDNDASGEPVLRGWTYARAREMRGLLPRKLNEICLLVSIDTMDSRPWQEQSLVDVAPENVARVRALRTTNAAFPEFRFDASDLANGKHWVADHSPLACRTRFVHYFHGVGNPKKKPCEWAIINFSEKEADEKFRAPVASVVNKWRGGRVPGGSSLESRATVVNLDSEDEAKQARGKVNSNGKLILTPGQTYTVGDTFAGAGGASRGITRAGLHLVFAVDHWDHAVSSLRMNFPKTDIYEMDITKFIVDKDVRYQVDMLHLSPPCQVWSPAHTTVGKNDEMNMAALFSCTDLVKKTKPRLFTLEQTFGMLHQRFSPFFNTLISGFTSHGYSVRWKVVHLATYGLPQPRKRLIIIGAGPGEKLPGFPRPTHGKDGKGGLKPFVPARQALAPIRRRGFKNHILHTKKFFDAPRNQWDPDQPIPRTITCSGGQNYHWKGTRDFTFLEYALLQGFPHFHKFHPSNIKKQIGNAFPSSVVRILYKHLAAELDKYDNVDSSSRIRNIGIPVNDETRRASVPIVISDSDPDPDALVFISSSRPTFRRVPDEESTLVRAAAAKRKRIHVDFTPARRLLRRTQAGAIVINDMDDSDMDYTEEVRRWSASPSLEDDPAYLSDGTIRSSRTPESIQQPRTPRGSEVVQPIILDLTGEMAARKKTGSPENPVVL
ncbi:hypothetical protein OQA88_7282 [Cercophora sp. LCS_1]